MVSSGGGLLTGKYAGGLEKAGESRFTNPGMQQRAATDQRKDVIIAAVQKVAGEAGRSPAQVAIAWLFRQNVIPIIGARRMAQFEDNLAAATLELSPEQLRTLDEVSKIELGFPHDFLNTEFVKNLSSGGTYTMIAGAS